MMNVKPGLHQIIRIASILCSLFMILTTSAAMAASAIVSWEANNPPPEGYRVFARRSDQAYNFSQPDWQGATATCIVNVEDQTEYFFVVRAYDGSMESTSSEEVRYTPPPASANLNPPAPIKNTPDTAPPAWNGATMGIGLATDTATGGSVTVGFDTANDVMNGTNLKFNVYYAASGAWNNADWSSNSVVADVATRRSTFAHAVTLSGLTNNVSYTFGVRAEDQSGNEDANTRTLKATPTLRQSASTYNLMLSAKPDRSGAVFLDDAGVEGNIYAFVAPITNVKRVEFFIDGVLRQTENVAPYDLSGGASGRADPFDADSLAGGYHAFSARITKTNGSSETITADVYVHAAGVVNTPPPVSKPVAAPSSSTYAQWVSTAPNRSQPEALDGATVGGLIYAFVEPITNIKKVEFFIDGVLKQTESYAPYDLAGGAAGGAAPFDADRLAVGNHSFSARITKTNGSSETITADVSVQ